MAEGNQEARWVVRWWGPVLLTSSAILFAAMAVFVRMAGYHGIPGAQTTLVRFTFGLVTVLLMHFFGLTRLAVRRPGWLVARGVTGGLAILFYFVSLSSVHGRGATPLTNSVLLGNSYFVFAPLFGAMLIRERLRPIVVVAILTALAGIYLVVSPDLGGVRMGDVYGLVSGILAGLAIVTVRELRASEPAPVIFLSLCVIGGLISAITMLGQGVVAPDIVGWGILCGMAVTSTAAQLILTQAFRYVPAGIGSLIAVSTVVYSALTGVLLFHEPFTAKFAIGAALVLGSAGYLALSYDGGQGV